MSYSTDYSDIKYGIQSDVQRYCWAAYNLFGILSSFVGDTLILEASHKGVFKINKILVTIIQLIAVSDLVNTITYLLPETISLLTNSWILGTTLCYARVYIVYITYTVGMYLIAVLTTAKFLILRYPIRAASWSTKRVHLVCSLLWAISLSNPMLFLVVDKYDIDFDYRQYACQYGYKSSAWRTIRPMAYFVGFIPNIAIIATTVPTLKYLVGARKSARRVQGSVPWQGAWTVILTTAVYCISTLPWMVYNVAQGFLKGNSKVRLFHVHYYRISRLLMMINVVANCYIYVFTIKSFRRFLVSKFRRIEPLSGTVSNPIIRILTTADPEGDHEDRIVRTNGTLIQETQAPTQQSTSRPSTAGSNQIGRVVQSIQTPIQTDKYKPLAADDGERGDRTTEL